jgi:hypothetical protein
MHRIRPTIVFKSDGGFQGREVALGGFHLLMSFLGSSGSMMAGSGLAELLQVLFGSNT